MMANDDPLQACAGLSADDLVALLALVNGTDISELHVTRGAVRFSLRRTASAAAVAATSPGTAPVEPSSLAITSPLVGIFRPSVSTGESVQPGQSIGAIETLGMPSTVDAPQGGTVEELLVRAGSPVEYGQPLLILRRAGAPPTLARAVES